MPRNKVAGESVTQRLIHWVKQTMGYITRVEWDSTEKVLSIDERNGDVHSIVNLKTVLLDLAYPVGTIYMSTSNVSPATFLGGTWVQIIDRFLVAAGDDYAGNTTGGTNAYMMKRSDIPNFIWETERDGTHGHRTKCEYGMSAGLNCAPSADNYMQPAGSSAGTRTQLSAPLSKPSGYHQHTTYLNGNQTQTGISLEPPCYGCYFWRRTA